MQQFARYLFKEYLFSTIFITSALVGTVWLTQSLRYIDFVMARGLSIFSFFKLIFFLLPNLIAVILPFSFFISVLFVLNQFYNDRELIIFQSVGLSNWNLTKPVIKISALICTTIYFLNFYFYPLSNQYYRASKNEVINNMTSSVLSPGEFTTFKKMTFYIKRKINAQNLEGLLVYDQRNSKNPITIIAQYAQIIELKNGLRLILINGNRQELDRNHQPTLISFDIYSLDLINSGSESEKEAKPGEYFINQLLNPPQGLNSKSYSKLKLEIHQRIIFPLLVFPFALLAHVVFLRGGYKRQGKYRKIGIALIVGLILEITLMIGLSLSQKNDKFIIVTYVLLGLSTLILTLQLFCNELKLKFSRKIST